VTNAEEIASRCLREMLTPLVSGSTLEDSEIFRGFQSALELLIPAELARTYEWWRYESLDAFRLCIARKLGSCEAELVGLCLLISDQSWTSFHLRIRIAPHSNMLERLDLNLGEIGTGRGGMQLTPYGSRNETILLSSLASRLESIQWAYSVTRTTEV
jgi:hypothetical protein